MFRAGDIRRNVLLKFIRLCMDTEGPHKRRVWLFVSKYQEVYGKILKSLTIVKLYRGMSKLKVVHKCKPTSVVVYCRFCGCKW